MGIAILLRAGGYKLNNKANLEEVHYKLDHWECFEVSLLRNRRHQRAQSRAIRAREEQKVEGFQEPERQGPV